MPKLKVCAVSYLNTVPLVWGMLHGEQRGMFELAFRVPAECADMLAAGTADIGIVPAYELLRQNLAIVPGVGIACRGPVRSILLVTKGPAREIRTLAADASSRTSVQLARVLLARRYGVHPAIVSHPPDLPAMLAKADAALVIGDPALRIDPAALPYPVHDLGAEWVEMTGLPMVFAVWAGRPEILTPGVVRAFQESCRFGLERMDAIVAAEAVPRGVSAELAHRYLSANIVHEFGPAEEEGRRLFLRYAGMDRAGAYAPPPARTLA